VTPGVPIINGVTPNSGQQGQQGISITITGTFTSFSNASVVTFGNSGVTASAPISATPTSITVNVSVAVAAVTGFTSITVTTGAQSVTLNNVFKRAAGNGGAREHQPEQRTTRTE